MILISSPRRGRVYPCPRRVYPCPIPSVSTVSGNTGDAGNTGDRKGRPNGRPNGGPHDRPHGRPFPQRRSIRLKGYDYSKAGLYFITICCHDRLCRFGEVLKGEMRLNEYGEVAEEEWTKLPQRFPNVEREVFQIMPNHMHGIIRLLKPHQAASAAPSAPSISSIIGAYKSRVFNACLKIYKSKEQTMGKLWQRNYYERIIRDEQAYQNIVRYILNNPAKWSEDEFHV